MRNAVLASLLIALTVACQNDQPAQGDGAAADDTYTLYRNSPLDKTFRIHIATFDSKEGYDDKLYNYENCERAKIAFENDPVFVGAKFFCDIGRYQG